MIEILPSLALIGSGAYMLWKGKDEDDGNGTTSQTTPNDNVQKIIDSHNAKGDTSVTKTENFNARGESTIVEEGNKLTLDKNNAMYFGDPNSEYDQFYDYSTHPTYNTNALLANSSAVANQRASAMRCRIVSPFLAESDVEPIFSNKGYYFTYAGNTMEVSQNMVSYIEFKANGKTTSVPCREYIGGESRQIAFVLEIFNPFQSTSHVAQIVLDKIKIGGELCQVVNAGGYCHDADYEQMKKANKHAYSSDGNNIEIKDKPFVMDVDIDINGRDSVFVPIALPLTKIVKTEMFDVYSDGTYWKKYYSGDKGLQLSTLLSRYDLHSWFWEESHSMVECIKGDCANHGIEYVVINTCEAPKSLTTNNLDVKVMLSSGNGKYTYNTEKGEASIQDGVSTAYLELKHSIRNGYETTSDWQRSYIGKELPTIMSDIEHRYDIRNALADNIFKENDGYPIHVGFPEEIVESAGKKTSAVSEWNNNIFGPRYSFTNDFTHKNLG